MASSAAEADKRYCVSQDVNDRVTSLENEVEASLSGFDGMLDHFDQEVKTVARDLAALKQNTEQIPLNSTS